MNWILLRGIRKEILHSFKWGERKNSLIPNLAMVEKRSFKNKLLRILKNRCIRWLKSFLATYFWRLRWLESNFSVILCWSKDWHQIRLIVSPSFLHLLLVCFLSFCRHSWWAASSTWLDDCLVSPTSFTIRRLCSRLRQSRYACTLEYGQIDVVTTSSPSVGAEQLTILCPHIIT